MKNKNKILVLVTLLLIQFSVFNISKLNAAPKTHDGFLFRYLVGPAIGSAEEKCLGCGSFDMNNGVFSVFEFGGAINDIAQLYVGFNFLNSSLKENSGYNTYIESVGLKNDVSYSETIIAFGASFYIPNTMLYIKPQINLSSSSTLIRNISDGFYSIPKSTSYKAEILSGYGLTIGKEWWVTNEGALGLAIFYQTNTLKSIEANIITNNSLKNSFYGLAFSATYN